MGKGRQGGRFYLRTQLNDALIESCHNRNGRLMFNQTDPYGRGSITGFGIEVLTS